MVILGSFFPVPGDWIFLEAKVTPGIGPDGLEHLRREWHGLLRGGRGVAHVIHHRVGLIVCLVR